MGAQHATFRVSRRKGVDDLCPQQSRRAHLGDFHIKIHADAPEKAQARRKIVNLEPCSNRGLDVFLTISERIGELQSRVSTCLLHVVARDRDGIELG